MGDLSRSISDNKETLKIISDLFVRFMGDLLEEAKISKINFVGIGNSISAGWCAVDNDVRPLVMKLEQFLGEGMKGAGIACDFGAFSLAGKNSNKEVLEFIRNNPNLSLVKELFSEMLYSWDRFSGTPFENCVDKESALSYYPASDIRFKDYYGNGELTITSFNGCTGKFLEDIPLNLLKLLIGRWDFLEDELNYLQAIISYIIGLSQTSYITVGNFPYIVSDYQVLQLLNKIIEYINKRIKSSSHGAMYFDRMSMELVSSFNGKLKIDNHPNIALQYNALGEYLLFLIDNLPKYMGIVDNGLHDCYRDEVSSYRIRLINNNPQMRII